MKEYTYNSFKGLKVRTIGADPSTEYREREPGIHDPGPQQCNPLGIAGRRNPEQNPLIRNPETAEQQKIAEVKALREAADKLEAANEKDLKKRNVRTGANELRSSTRTKRANSTNKQTSTETND